MYAIDNELTAKRIVFSIQEELEAIVGEILPSDYEFLVNRIYNYITFPKEEIPPQIRIKKVTKNGLSGVIYGEKGTFPIVKSKGEYFTIVTITPNEEMGSVIERLGLGSSVSIKSTICKDIIDKFDKSILPTGYIESVGETYKINSRYREKDSELNRVYILENGEINEIFDCTSYGSISESEVKKTKEFYRGEKNSVHYAFFKIIFKS